jgi:hypothetical protein
VVPSLAKRWSHAPGGTHGGLKGSAQRLGELTNVVELIEEDMDAEEDVSRG